MSDATKRKVDEDDSLHSASSSLNDPQAIRTPDTTPADVESDGFIKVITREEKRKIRKLEKHRPQFQFDISYFRQGKKIGIAHIRDLVLHLLADGQKPNWIVAENKSSLKHVVVLLVPGLLPEHLGLPAVKPSACLPFSTTPASPLTAKHVRVPIIPKLFSYGVPCRAPGDRRRLHSVASIFLNCPIPDSVREKRDSAIQSESTAPRDETALQYVLSPNQMIEHDYPLPSYLKPGVGLLIPGHKDPLGQVSREGYHRDTTVDPYSFAINMDIPGRDFEKQVKNKRNESWIQTPEAVGPPPDGVYPILSIDCEMCQSADGKELTRLSIVEFYSGRTVFDELIMPSVPITDYLTQWSGITQARLSKATLTLAELQRVLINTSAPIITGHTILLGHSLECDLTVLRLRHPMCIDTSILFSHPKGPPYKPGLRWLCSKWLRRAIQGGTGGHDSEEDARACVDLLKLKTRCGPAFGTATTDFESIFDRIARFHPGGQPSRSINDMSTLAGPKRSVMAAYGIPAVERCESKTTTMVPCFNDEEVLRGIQTHIAEHDFVFGRMSELEIAQGWNNLHDIDRSASSTPSFGRGVEKDVEHALEQFNRRLEAVHSSIPKSTALIVMTGHADPRPTMKLLSRHSKWEGLVRGQGIESVPSGGKWLSEDERELEREVILCREGMAFFCVK